jgi:Na+/H+-dicarboxylate symporter
MFLLQQVRERELELIRETAVIKTLNLCLVFAVPPAIALVIFATYAYNVGKLTSSTAFVVLSLFNTLRFPLVVLPKALRGASGMSQPSIQLLTCMTSASQLGGTASQCLRNQPALPLIQPKARHYCVQEF